MALRPDLRTHFRRDQGAARTAGEGHRRQEGSFDRVGAAIPPSRAPGAARRCARPGSHRPDASLVRAVRRAPSLAWEANPRAAGSDPWRSRIGPFGKQTTDRPFAEAISTSIAFSPSTLGRTSFVTIRARPTSPRSSTAFLGMPRLRRATSKATLSRSRPVEHFRAIHSPFSDSPDWRST